ncbi:MAG TPA: TolC family protein [Candidatus Glassbacteria bacterium]|nr:TolC family protein [Candidatus Glassbacteria bacterium]
MSFKWNKFLPLPLIVLAAAVLVPASPAGLAAADTLSVSLAEVIGHARANSPQILAARSQAESARGMELASLAGFFPHLTLSEVFTRGNDPVFAFGSKLRQGIFSQTDFSIPALNEPSALTNYATRVVVEQPLFNGGKSFYGRRTASAYADAAGHGSAAVEDATLFGIEQAYYSVILTRETLKVVEAALEAARSHERQATQMMEVGMVTRADQLKAQVRLSELEQQRISARNLLEVMGENLKLASGWDTGEILLPADELRDKELLCEIESLTDYALTNQPALAAARSTAVAADYSARAAWGEAIPSLNGFFLYERDGDGAFAGDGDNWMVGVSLDWKFFDGFGNAGKIKSYRALKEKAAWEATLARHRVEVEVKEAWLDAGAAGKMMAVARQATEQAAESLRILENQYGEGLATITDLLDTELAATNSRLSLVKALYDYNVSIARISLVTGGYPVN